MSELWIDGIPATKGSWKVQRGKLRPDNERERPWANAIAWTAKTAGLRPGTAPMVVVVNLYFPRPKKPSNPFPSRNDVDKLARSVLDALTGIAWNDDQQVVDLRITKAFVEHGSTPGALIVIKELAQ